MRFSLKSLALVLMGGLVLAGCATSPEQYMQMVGKKTIVERSAGSRPNWILKPFQEKGKIFWISGGVESVADYALGLREAKGEAIKNVSEAVQVKVQTLFEKAVTGQNAMEGDLERAVQDVIAMAVDNLKISGIKPKENYYEKVEVVTESGLEYEYNCYSLLTMDRADYKKAVRMAIAKEKQKAKDNTNAKAAMEKVEKRLYEETQ